MIALSYTSVYLSYLGEPTATSTVRVYSAKWIRPPLPVDILQPLATREA
jgi:hypothetical protein